MSGFPFEEACLLGAGESGISWGLHHLGSSPPSTCLGMLPGRWGFSICGGPWPVAGVCGPSWLVLLFVMFGSLDILLVEVFECIHDNFLRISMPL